jgi:hypothetical protein
MQTARRVSWHAATAIFVVVMSFEVWLYGFSPRAIPKVWPAATASYTTPGPTWTCIGACPGGTSGGGGTTDNSLVFWAGAAVTAIVLVVFIAALLERRSLASIVKSGLTLVVLGGLFATGIGVW